MQIGIVGGDFGLERLLQEPESAVPMRLVRYVPVL